MKALINVILCAATAFLVSGCWPYGGGGGGGTSYYYTLNNPEEADSATALTKSNTTFRIVAPALQAPMIQKRGQVKIYFDAGNSVSGALAVGVGKRSFLLAGISGGTTDWSETDQLYLDLEYVTSSNPNGAPTDVSGYYPYERKTHASAVTAEFAFGQYRQWGKKFRYEWFGGLGYGRYENSHEVVMENQLYYFNTDQFESQFSDKRKVLNFLFQNNVAWVTDYSELIVMGRLNSFMFASRETEMQGQTDVPGYSPWAFAFEPGVRFALGGNRLKLYVHYETVIPVETSGVDWLKSQLRGGVVFRL